MMMKKFSTRLTLMFMLLIGLSVLAAGIYMAKKLESSHLDALGDHLKRQIRLMLATMEWDHGEGQSSLPRMDNYAELVSHAIGARVTFLKRDGSVLGDSEKNPQDMDNHLNREEVREALAAGEGYSIRYSETIGQNMLNVALPVMAGDQVIGVIRLSQSVESVEAKIHALWSALISGLLVVFVAAGLLSYRFARGLTRPLEKITRVAQRIRQLDYTSRVHISQRDEIGQLGVAINSMADSLQLQVNRIMENENRLKNVLDNMISGVVMIDRGGGIVLLNRAAEDILGFHARELLGKNYNVAKRQQQLLQCIEEVMERHEPLREEFILHYPQERVLEASLVPMTDVYGEWAGIVIVLHDISALRRLEKMRSEFAANVSHELKTPIAAIKGFAETLLSGAMHDRETATAFLQIIFDESERLNRLIEDILELSKIESKRVPLRFSPVHLHSFIAQSLRMVEADAKNKRIALRMEVDEELYIEADEDRLRQILINLLSNGINYTTEGGVVEVRTLLMEERNGEPERVRLLIADTGIGIPRKDVPRIFERFYRVDKARSRSSGGTGLGLSIVKHLVELHQGTIRVESEVGVGSRFMIDLPLMQP